MDGTAMSCPFCGYKPKEFAPGQQEYAVMLHMEEHHSEGQSPFVSRGNADGSAGRQQAQAQLDKSEEDSGRHYAECPVEGCGEVVSANMMNYHIELHAEEADDGTSDVAAARRVDAPSLPRSAGPSSAQPRQHQHEQEPKPSKRQRAILDWKKIFKMGPSTPSSSSSSPADYRVQEGFPGTSTPNKRLGKAHLGKYAHEDRMPDWLIDLLRKGGMVSSEGVIPVIAQLLEQSPSTKYAYLCHPCVQHVSKLKKEGGFCGYRNIQMMFSYINGVDFAGSREVNRRIPSIFRIQELVESAWDCGISPEGREETGGIRGTRKYIGTPEALAVLRLLNVPTDTRGFRHKEPGRSETLLMEDLESYFQSGVVDPTQDIRRTSLPPIYFQHAGHSMTIIGLEKLLNGSRNLLVFDPMFQDSPHIMRYVGRQFEDRFPDTALKSYRRGRRYLRKYHAFEILKLRAPPQGFVPLPLEETV